MNRIFAGLLLSFGLAAQPEINFDANADFLKLPPNLYLGEVAGVAADSHGNIFVYTRTGHPTITIGTARPFAHGGSRLFEFDRGGKFVREIGQDSYGFLVAQQVRVDSKDNVWVVDQMSNMVIKFDPNRQVQLLLGRKDESEQVPARPLNAAPGGRGRGGPPGAGAQSDLFRRPADVAWDSAGNIYVADGLGNSRIAKFDPNGKFIKSWGQTGSGQGQFNQARSIVIDAQDNVYVADAGNKRIQVFDRDGGYKTEFTGIGAPSALCISPGAHQVIYSSNSNPPDDIDSAGEIYKLDLTGKVIGKFGRAGKSAKEFGTVNAISCRSENELLVGEIGNWRVQRVTLH
ncbi:MAG TPA: peptidyl-alpha-hydroxyglycine alpha-amidating lyase family protein [Bryobacteraceae bacterium]|jgi:DNA-binding beta-propeller fold protein YncE|nr:peptidyl-alpha-hydroxyglycine alpha-amidating lyase family protein [Bryobacteraceae bacterium]